MQMTARARFFLAYCAMAGTAMALLSSGIRAQAGTSLSVAGVTDMNRSSLPQCEDSTGPVAVSSFAHCGPVFINGQSATVYARSLSENSSRTINSSISMHQYGGGDRVHGGGYSYQYSGLEVNGSGATGPVTGDQLVFHFVTSQSATGSGGHTAYGGGAYSSWDLFLEGSGGSSTVNAEAYREGYPNATQSAVSLTNAVQTATGFDFFLPFALHYPNDVSGVFTYDFYGDAYVVMTGQPSETVLNASLSATLQGIDLVSPTGQYINSASFDPVTGIGSLDAFRETTVPEPSAAGLITIGLVGLVPIARRKTRT